MPREPHATQEPPASDEMTTMGDPVQASHPRALGRGAAYLLLTGVTLVLMARGLLERPMAQDSFWIDVVWADQFTALLRNGTVYPRWLPDSFNGLGAPVFYFYPPLAFYVAAIFGLLGLSAYGSVMAAFVAGMFASGVAMYEWLKGWTRHALPCACLYMAAPYHLIDFYRRGALAEFLTAAIIPVVAIGLRRARNGKVGVLAVSYALLIMTHLPVALLASLLLVLPLAVTNLRRSHIISIGTGLLLGLGLASFYLLPALMLQDHVSIGRLWQQSHLRIDHWNLLRATLLPKPDPGVLLFFSLTLAMAIPAAVLLRKQNKFWPALTLVTCAFVAGGLPYAWSLPLVAKVQFPWRALVIAEFGFATALAASRARPALLMAAVVPMLTISGLFLTASTPPGEHQLDEALMLHFEVPEYLPRGTPPEIGSTSRWALALASRQPILVIQGGQAIARRFYFPAWRVRCQGRIVPTFPDPVTRLLRYPGDGNCLVERVWTGPEKAGLALSLISLLLLLLLLPKLARRSAQTALRILPPEPRAAIEPPAPDKMRPR